MEQVQMRGRAVRDSRAMQVVILLAIFAGPAGVAAVLLQQHLPLLALAGGVLVGLLGLGVIGIPLLPVLRLMRRQQGAWAALALCAGAAALALLFGVDYSLGFWWLWGISQWWVLGVLLLCIVWMGVLSKREARTEEHRTLRAAEVPARTASGQEPAGRTHVDF